MRGVIVLLFVVSCFGAKGQSKPDRIPVSRDHYYALIAGGSKGIGYAIAEALAKRKYNLILIARNPDTLAIAKSKLEKKYKVAVEILSYDLSRESSAPAIAAWCIERDIQLKMLCNVAGLGGDDDYLKLSLDSVRYMVNLNVESGLAMTMLLLPLLEKNAPAYVMNVASMAGLAPIPSKNVYAATKSAVIFFSYGLRYQLKPKGIKVSCLAPGPVFTKKSIKEETKQTLGWFGKKMAVSPARVGEVAVRKTLKGRMLIVPGTLAKLTSAAIRVMPRRLAASLYARVDKKE
ncbi:MAG TPA: SDR family NAD(P)-dependent oxidoreductase [Chryseosolibacter sp.]